MLTTSTISSWAKMLGFTQAGFCRIDSFIRSYEIVQSQPALSERKHLRFFPEEDLPDAKSIAVLLWPYKQAPLPAQGEVFVDSYYSASNAAYHAARRLEEQVLSSGHFAKANVAYPAKEAALRAHMGLIGHHSLLITRQHGSRVVIILMATDIELPDQETALVPQNCLKCGRCMKSCPTGAIDETGFSHPERCLRNFMLEGVVVPEEMRSKIGMRMIGCDICQRVCPMQPQSSVNQETRYSLFDFVAEDPSFSKAIEKLSIEIGRNAARPQRVRAQAALLAGNSKDKKHLPVLRQWAKLPFEAVSKHANWAIEQIESHEDHT